MKASVVIPTYQRQKQLISAINSVIEQSYPPVETIVVATDPSEFNELEKIQREKYQGKGVKILYSSIRLLGGAARNIGWRNAVGDIIFFLDDDDTFEKDKLDCHIKSHHSFYADIVYSDPWLVYGNGKVKHGKQNVTKPLSKSNLFHEGFCPASTSCVSVSRNCLESQGGFDESLPSYQDFELWLRLLKAGCSFHHIAQPLTFFTQHDSERVSLDRDRRMVAAAQLIKMYPDEHKLPQFVRSDIDALVARKAILQARSGNISAVKTYFRGILSGNMPANLSTLFKIPLKIIFGIISSRFSESSSKL